MSIGRRTVDILLTLPPRAGGLYLGSLVTCTRPFILGPFLCWQPLPYFADSGFYLPLVCPSQHYTFIHAALPAWNDHPLCA